MRAIMMAIVGRRVGDGTGRCMGGAEDRRRPTVEAKVLREMASAIPLGSRVKAQTSGGARVNGTLMSVTDEAGDHQEEDAITRTGGDGRRSPSLRYSSCKPAAGHERGQGHRDRSRRGRRRDPDAVSRSSLALEPTRRSGSSAGLSVLDFPFWHHRTGVCRNGWHTNYGRARRRHRPRNHGRDASDPEGGRRAHRHRDH